MSDGLLAHGDEHPLAALIRSAIGTGTYDRVAVTLPQFDRTDGIRVQDAPVGERGFDVLREIPAEWLESLGCILWSCDDGQEHWLFPAEWYASIPEGYEVVTIMGRRVPFRRGVQTPDRRGGALAYGFVRKAAK